MNADFKINNLKLETERLILRPFLYSDLEDFYEYASKDGVGEKAGWKHHENIEETKQILDIFRSEDKTFAIVLKSNNKVIGSIGIEKYKREESLTEFENYKGRELGFVLSKDYWGNKIMLEALNAIINYLFNVLNYDFLICGHFESNAQSKKVQERCFFKPYREIMINNIMNQKEKLILNLLLNPNKNIKLSFSHKETLIYKE